MLSKQCNVNKWEIKLSQICDIFFHKSSTEDSTFQVWQDKISSQQLLQRFHQTASQFCSNGSQIAMQI